MELWLAALSQLHNRCYAPDNRCSRMDHRVHQTNSRGNPSPRSASRESSCDIRASAPSKARTDQEAPCIP